jgi:hypothetical protein
MKLKWPPYPPSHRTLRIANMAVATVAMVMAMNADHRWSAMLLAWVCGFNLAAAIACTFYIRMQESFEKLGEAFHAMAALNEQLIDGKVRIRIVEGDWEEVRGPSLH